MPSSKGWRRRKDDRTLRGAPIGEVIDGLLRERVLARGVAIGHLASVWPAVVGPRLGAESTPVSLEAGVLVVATTTGPWGAQVAFLAEEIRRRANEELGSEDVVKVRVVVHPQRW
jgi:hypothetical protein